MLNLLTAWSVKCRADAGLRTGTRIDDLPLWCGINNSSGVDEVAEWQDWTEQETTPDQERIEAVLQGAALPRCAILHVGVGNSSLAKKFHATARIIDGITIQENERQHAQALALENYTASLANKYDHGLALKLNRKYDFIVDNNPTTFCCCRRHLSAMLANYAAMLKSGGVILTDAVGLHWTSEPNDPRWKLTESEWWTLGAMFGLRGLRYTDYVIGLKKGLAIRSAFQLARIAARRISLSRSESD